MSIKYNGKTIAGGYTPVIADETQNGITRLSSNEEFTIGENTTSVVTPYQVNNFGATVLSNNGLITNCITKVPQRIKADIVDGTLTVYAGSIAVVPYGTDAPTYSVGDFLLGEANNNLYKIVDIQYDPTDDTPQLYYWCELQRDVSQTAPTTSSTTVKRLISLNLDTENSLVYNAFSWSQDTLPSDSNSYQWYQPTNNKCVHVSSTHVVNHQVISFPILKVVNSSTQVYGKIDRIFNSQGYIGCARWYDKDIVGVAPAGINLDGTYKNIISKLNKLILVNSGASDRTYVDRLRLPTEGVKAAGATRQYQYTREVESYSDLASFNSSASWCIYVKNDNLIYINNITTNEWEISYAVYASQIYINSNGVIEDFQPYQPIRIANTQDLDGKWVKSGKLLISFKNYAKNSAYDTINCNEFLPNDGHIYECMFRSFWKTPSATTTSGSCPTIISSGLQPLIFGKINQNAYGDVTSMCLVDSSKFIQFGILASSSSNIENASLYLDAYRRVQ